MRSIGGNRRRAPAGAQPTARTITSAADIDRLVQSVENDLGSIDILINNAYVNIRGTVTELSESDWDSVIDTNLKDRSWSRAPSARGWSRADGDRS